jgi:hypothetical protein
MIRLKDLLSEKNKVFDIDVRLVLKSKSMKLAQDRFMPLTPKIANIIYSTTIVRGYHMNEFNGIRQLINIQGSKKAVSISTKFSTNNRLCGPVRCGAAAYIEGTLLFNAWKDMASVPDEAGRRWIDIGKLDIYFQKKYNNYINSDNEHNTILNNYKHELSLIDRENYKKKIDYIDKRINYINNIKRSYIDKYISLSEKFFSDKDNAATIRAVGGQSDSGKELFADNNEMVVNKIKIIDVMINGDNYNYNVDGSNLLQSSAIAIKQHIYGNLYLDISDANIKKFFSSKVGIINN